MQRIFPKLYRFIEEPHRKGRKFFYFIVRKQGNLLMGHLGSSVRDYFDDIEKLGGVHAQFITHVHEADPVLHDEIHARFGAKLCYHKAARKLVREVSECPEIVFDNDGLQVDNDFEALFFPFHTPGHSIFRWRYRGKHFLFTGHVVSMVNGRWELWFDPTKAPKLRGEYESLAVADYVLPTRSPYGQEEFHCFNEYTRAAFSEALNSAWVVPHPYHRIVAKITKAPRTKRKKG